jgi:hypothetical protein
MTVVYIEPRPKGRPEGTAIVDYAAETSADVELETFDTQEAAVEWAKAHGFTPYVARVRDTDKGNSHHWRTA